MHIECVRFDEIFDTVPRSGAFSFRSDGRPYYGVQAIDRAIPRAGARYAVVLSEPGNWAGLIGWRELGSSRVAFRYSVLDVLITDVGDILLLTPLLFGAAFVFIGPWTALAAALAPVGVACYRTWHTIRQQRALRRRLLSIDCS